MGVCKTKMEGLDDSIAQLTSWEKDGLLRYFLEAITKEEYKDHLDLFDRVFNRYTWEELLELNFPDKWETLTETDDPKEIYLKLQSSGKLTETTEEEEEMEEEEEEMEENFNKHLPVEELEKMSAETFKKYLMAPKEELKEVPGQALNYRIGGDSYYMYISEVVKEGKVIKAKSFTDGDVFTSDRREDVLITGRGKNKIPGVYYEAKKSPKGRWVMAGQPGHRFAWRFVDRLYYPRLNPSL